MENLVEEAPAYQLNELADLILGKVACIAAKVSVPKFLEIKQSSDLQLLLI